MHLARRAKHVRVIPIGEDLTPPTLHHAVQRARKTDFEPLHATREAHSIARLDDHVNVVALHGVVDEARVVGVARGRSEGVFDATKGTLAAESVAFLSHAERDVDWMVA